MLYANIPDSKQLIDTSFSSFSETESSASAPTSTPRPYSHIPVIIGVTVGTMGGVAILVLLILLGSILIPKPSLWCKARAVISDNDTDSLELNNAYETKELAYGTRAPSYKTVAPFYVNISPATPTENNTSLATEREIAPATQTERDIASAPQTKPPVYEIKEAASGTIASTHELVVPTCERMSSALLTENEIVPSHLTEKGMATAVDIETETTTAEDSMNQYCQLNHFKTEYCRLDHFKIK